MAATNKEPGVKARTLPYEKYSHMNLRRNNNSDKVIWGFIGAMTQSTTAFTSSYLTTIQNDTAPKPVVEASLNNVPKILCISLKKLYTTWR